MAKRFVFRNPEQLKAIVKLCKDGSASKVMNVARVWSVTCRQKEGTNDQMCVLGWLKYNAALEWCRENLEEAQL